VEKKSPDGKVISGNVSAKQGGVGRGPKSGEDSLSVGDEAGTHQGLTEGLGKKKKTHVDMAGGRRDTEELFFILKGKKKRTEGDGKRTNP